MQLTSVCYTTFTAITKANVEVRTARSVKGKRRPYQHYSAAASPRFGCSNMLLLFQGAESFGQRDYSIFGQEGICRRMSKDIGDLHLANCSTLYSAVLDSVHSYNLWGLNFVGSPGTKFMPHKNLTQNFCTHENFYDYSMYTCITLLYNQ